MKKQYWVTKEGKRIAVDDMSEDHVRNTLALILRRMNDDEVRYVLSLLIEEKRQSAVERYLGDEDE